jgi:hypothetical protein
MTLYQIKPLLWTVNPPTKEDRRTLHWSECPVTGERYHVINGFMDANKWLACTTRSAALAELFDNPDDGKRRAEEHRDKRLRLGLVEVETPKQAGVIEVRSIPLSERTQQAISRALRLGKDAASDAE